MLILLLEPNEKKNEVLIGNDISVKLLDIYKDTNQVRIGIEAPKDVSIDRTQVREQREKRIKEVLSKHTIEG